MSSYHTQGAVPLNSDAYIERPFEQKVLRNILAGNWVLLLGPRQHGKTTSLIRINHQLQNAGLISVMIDLQAMPPCNDYQELVKWFVSRIEQILNVADTRSSLSKLYSKGTDSIARALGVGNAEKSEEHETRQLDQLLESILPQSRTPIVIIIDEASAIPNTEWRNAFYGQIRAIANLRAVASDEDLAARVRFLFAGSFRPENLVNDLNSPFNVCERIETDDLLLEDANNLMEKVVSEQNQAIVKQVYDIVGGQPYLLQFIFSKVQLVDEYQKQQACDEAIALLRSGQNDHFEGVFKRVFAEAELISIVSALAKDGRINNEPANPNYRYLQVLGIAKREGAYLVFRNQLYQEFARSSSQLLQELNSTSILAPLIAPSEDVYSFMQSNELREIAYSMELGAVRAHNCGNYRLALVGFGSALEALLIDWLSSLSSSDLNNATRLARRDRTNQLNFNHFEDNNDPGTWRLVNLIKVARKVANAPRIIDPPEAVREWRNVIHPSVARTNYLPEKDLAPESQAACGFLGMLRRDIEAII